MNLQLEIGRAERLLEDLHGLMFTDVRPIASFQICDSNQPDCPDETAGWTSFSCTETWRGKNRHSWFRTDIFYPEEYSGKSVVFQLSTGREGQWDATNPQMLFYYDKVLLQGMDVNHTEVLLTENAQPEESHEAAFLAFSGTAGEELVLKARTAVLHTQIRSLYFDLLIPTQSARLLQKNDPENSGRILRKLAPALDALDLREPYSSTFWDSLDKAGALLKESFYTETDENGPVVSAVGHTHIDVAWLWTVEQAREKALRSFATVIKLMEEYPEYRFMSSQPILYQFVKEQAPDLYEKIRQRIREGRWEADGAMWLEADSNLSGGESLVRQLLKGHRFFKEEFGVESKCLWLPDVFGYSAALPQILRKSNIPYFMTTKLSWNQFNQLPNDTFSWRGIDGSEVFVFMPTACNADRTLGTNVSFSDSRNTTTYTAVINPNMALGTHQRFQNKDLTENTLMLYGYGDGGGGPTREMLESARRLHYGIPGIPRIKLEGEREFFDRTYHEIGGCPDLPSWDGELYFEYHRGTYTSMAQNKRGNRKNELLYEKLESLSTLTGQLGQDYPSELIAQGWDVLLLNQFHDILPGTAISEVYERSSREYAEIWRRGRDEVERRLHTLALKTDSEGLSVLVFNSQGYLRDDVAAVKLPEGVTAIGMRDETGMVLPVQRRNENQWSFFAKNLPPLGYQVFSVVTGEGPAPTLLHQADPLRFENAYYCVEILEDMTISSLVEKETGNELICSGGLGNRLMGYEDRPINWDNWDIDHYYSQKPYPPCCTVPVHVVEDGPVCTVLEGETKISGSTIVQRMILYHDLPRIDVEHLADWQNHHLLLRTEFNVDIYNTRAAYEIQFGSIERETTSNNSWDSAKFEVCGHKWADLSDNGHGLSLLNDCKYGYSIRHGKMGLTLIKSGVYPNAQADIGEHRYTYSIYPHSGTWHQAKTVEMAYDLNVPLEAVAFSGGRGSLPKNFSLVQTNCENCFVEVFKQAEDGNGSVLRVYENQKKRTNVSFSFGAPLHRVWECDLMENTLREVEHTSNSFTDTLKPFEIKTYRILWSE